MKAGLDPTKKFTTNISESLNHVIKQEVEWKENKLPVLITHLKSITEQHVEELKKAVISQGEWKFITAFKHLEIPQGIWFSQGIEFKEKHMKKVHNRVVHSLTNCPPQSEGDCAQRHLSVPCEN